MRTLAAIFVVGFLALALYAIQPWKWLAPAPNQPQAAAGRSASGPFGAAADPPLHPASDLENAPVTGADPGPASSPADPAAAASTPAESAPPANGATPHDPTHVPNPTQPIAPGVPKIDTFDVIPSERTLGVDGMPIFDGEFPLKGQGTPDSPYEVSWAYLTTVERTYDPSIGRRQIPDRITMLAGKHVRISGHIAFPLFDNRPNELLVMLNQWDGCCIGVPPTPYDAIEVRLAAPITGEARYATYGTITGKLGVEPYVVTSSDGKLSFLLGIYVLDGAAMSGDEFGGFGGEGF